MSQASKLILDKACWKILEKVQKAGNKVVWTEDQKNWGKPEVWEFPKEVGDRKFEDCDGITLYKMRALIEAGIDPDALSFVVCYDPAKQGHAVLCVVTDRGDYILDNQQAGVRAYPDLKAEGYRFMYRSTPGSVLGAMWQTIEA